MTQIDYQKAQECLLALIELAVKREEVVIARDQRPLVKIVEFVKQPKKRRRFGSAKGLIKIADDFMQPLEDFREYQ
jgi:antitoxin (DNA-binding transcriptional repressor) of toxin-antitoxin stability system